MKQHDGVMAAILTKKTTWQHSHGFSFTTHLLKLAEYIAVVNSRFDIEFHLS